MRRRQLRVGAELDEGDHVVRLRAEPRCGCVLCGERKPATVRRPDGAAICQECFFQKVNLKKCSVCREVGPVHFRTDDNKPVCSHCYVATVNVACCSACGRTKDIAG